MRPYPHEILRSIRQTLNETLIPNLGDRWAVYAAKNMDRMLVHLEIRALREPALLVEDAADLQRVLTDLVDALGRSPLDASEELARLRERLVDGLDRAAAAPPDPASLVSLTEHDEELRGLVVDAIEAADRAAAADAAVAAALAEPRQAVGRYLRRGLDRDVELAEPTFISFAPRAAERRS